MKKIARGGLFLFSTLVVSIIFALSTSCGRGGTIITRPPSQTPPPTQTQANGVYTYHNNVARTGLNPNETTLTPANVNKDNFGKLCTYAVDGFVYTQPLYVKGVQLSSSSPKDVVYIGTEHDSVYAFDTHCGQQDPYWHVSFIDPAHGATTVSADDVLSNNTGPEVGITGTPVIDPTNNLLYVVAATKENGQFFQRLHILDIRTGAEKTGSPVEIKASVVGIGDSTDGNGKVLFSPQWQNQRSALLLVDHTLYIGWGSHHINRPWHGWLLAYDTNTLQQVAALNTTPNGWGGGIWMSGNGPSYDGAAGIFVQSGQGTYTADQGGPDFGDSIFRLSKTDLSRSDYFTPYDQEWRLEHDADTGTAGPVLLPDQSSSHPKLLLSVSKDGNIYLVDRENMGHYNPGMDIAAQVVRNAVGIVPSLPSLAGNGAGYNTPAYWNGHVYFCGRDDVAKSFSLRDGTLSVQPTSQAADVADVRGGGISVSSNGDSNAILWVLQWKRDFSILFAYDATDLSRRLYSSEDSGTRDHLGAAASKFAVPTVYGGNVYTAGQNFLAVFGPLH
jgi:hypothetical protein